MTTQNSIAESIFVARQPVFYSDQTLWGYELLFRSNMDNVAHIQDGDQATSAVVADGLTIALDGLRGKPHILINFPETLLTQDIGFVLPKQTCVIEILEDVNPSQDVLRAVYRLKKAGYTIAVDDFFGQPKLKPFLKYTDIVKIDVLELEMDPIRIQETIAPFKGQDIQLLAEKVEDAEAFDCLKKMGFTLFQGFFFSKPEILTGKKLTSNELTKLRLLSELSNEFEPKRLADILQSDPSLSYRLFRFINSVGTGLHSKVDSLKRAIDMMGMLQVKHWICSAVLADMSSSPTGEELVYMAVQRAKFLEGTCDINEEMTCDPDSMFMSGLFSLLDAMLGINMATILDQLPLDESIIKGLTEEGDIQDLITLMELYEHGQWEATLSLRQKLGMPQDDVEKLFIQSQLWAQRMLGHTTSDSEKKTGQTGKE